MKVKLETLPLLNRGVELESETEEETGVLLDLWLKNGRPACFTRLPNDVIQLSIAPTATEDEKQ